MSLNWFAHIVVCHRYIILAVVGVFSGSCLVIPFTLRAFPDFSDPQMGFETRGTQIANRITAWKNLMEATQPSGLLAVNPKGFLFQKHYMEQAKQKKKKKGKKQVNKEEPHIFVDKVNPRNNSEESNWITLENLVNSKTDMKHVVERVKSYGVFCGRPDEEYVQIVLKSLNGKDLFTLQSLLSMCRIEHEFIQTKHYKDLCIQTAVKPRRCCKPWSLGNYVALLHNRTSCLAITEEDVLLTRKLLHKCSQYYHNLNLASDCTEKGNCMVPLECAEHDAVFNILNYLTSVSFLPPNKSSELFLEETMMFLPIACSTAALPYYHALDRWKLEYEGIAVVAMEFGIKSALFDEYLLRDAWLMSSGGLFVLFCMWLYTGSLFLTIMTIIAIVFSLGISYFLYMLVFELRFFPFMNLLATVVAIGIGADDAFIFCKMWELTKREKSSSVVATMSDTIHHAFFSMFVTSITTAVAFLASYVSSVTAICCFSIFAGMAVISNCLLMMSWFPACVVVWERSCTSTKYGIIKSCTIASLQRLCCCQFLQPVCNFAAVRSKCKNTCFGRLWNARERLLLDGIINYRFFWLISLSTIAIASAVVVLYYPKLQLPNSLEFQLLDSSHPFEQYDLIYKNKFRFKRVQKAEAYSLPMRFVWGILPEDEGNYLDPNSRGKLQLDSSFDVSEPESQAWLLQFCRNLRRQPFYQPTLGPLLPNCFIESFISWMQRRCFDSIDNMDRTPCCEVATFPYNRSVFNTCIVRATADLYETPAEYFIPGVAGPKFSKDQFPTIKVVVVEYDSNYSFSMSFNYMHKFYTQVESWMRDELKEAPVGMKNGWFISELDFYDIQRELSECTLVAIAMSMGLALIVLLLSTLNVLTSLFAIVTITCSILVTMAVLVLLGWKLNVLESIAVSTAIGLTVDFSLHYTVNYRLCPVTLAKDRVAATRYALNNMMGPACMAAITTGAAGAFMMPSSILAYTQIGIFLVTVMTVSWLYATFHLGSMLAVAGPEDQFCQFHYSKIASSLVKTSKDIGRNRPATSSISDTHELDSLTSKCGVRPVPKALHRSLSGGKNDHNNRYVFTDQSPSATSTITIITTEDN